MSTREVPVCSWHTMQRRPARTYTIAFRIGQGRRVPVMILPWLGLVVVKMRMGGFAHPTARILSCIEDALHRHLGVRTTKPIGVSASIMRVRPCSINPLEIRRLLEMYKRSECHFEAYLDELVIYHGRSILVCRLSEGVVYILGDQWSTFRSRLFLSGLIAMLGL